MTAPSCGVAGCSRSRPWRASFPRQRAVVLNVDSDSLTSKQSPTRRPSTRLFLPRGVLIPPKRCRGGYRATSPPASGRPSRRTTTTQTLRTSPQSRVLRRSAHCLAQHHNRTQSVISPALSTAPLTLCSSRAQAATRSSSLMGHLRASARTSRSQSNQAAFRSPGWVHHRCQTIHGSALTSRTPTCELSRLSEGPRPPSLSQVVKTEPTGLSVAAPRAQAFPTVGAGRAGGWPLLPKCLLNRDAPTSPYPGLAGRQLAAGIGGQGPARRLPLFGG
jgi:hypothetical protein